MMAHRLVELHRVLKPTGSIYLHCEPYGQPLPQTADGRRVSGLPTSATKSLGAEHRRIATHPGTGQTRTRYCSTRKASNGRGTLNIRTTTLGMRLDFASKTPTDVFGPTTTLLPRAYPAADTPMSTEEQLPSGAYLPKLCSVWTRRGGCISQRPGGIRLKRYLDEMKGRPAQALWDDIDPINSQAKERLGYPTPKAGGVAGTHHPLQQQRG